MRRGFYTKNFYFFFKWKRGMGVENEGVPATLKLCVLSWSQYSKDSFLKVEKLSWRDDTSIFSTFCFLSFFLFFRKKNCHPLPPTASIPPVHLNRFKLFLLSLHLQPRWHNHSCLLRPYVTHSSCSRFVWHRDTHVPSRLVCATKQLWGCFVTCFVLFPGFTCRSALGTSQALSSFNWKCRT